MTFPTAAKQFLQQRYKNTNAFKKMGMKKLRRMGKQRCVATL
jgi:hypothetical protein